MRIRYLIDADALLCMRSLQLIPVLRVSEKFPRPVVVTEYVARRELFTIDREIRALEAEGVVQIEPVLRKNADFRRLLSEGADKGEAEAIAWALSLPRGERPLSVSLDVEARKYADSNGVPADDLMGFLADLIDIGVLSLAEAVSHTEPWQDQKQQRGRPRDFTTFDETLARRRAGRGSL